MFRCIPLFFILLTFALPTRSDAQVWKQVYPAFIAEEYTSVLATSPDTVYVTGLNFTVLRSTNGGRQWETLYRTLGEFDIARSGFDGKNLYLLPSGLPFSTALREDSSRGFLFVYNAQRRDTSRMYFPTETSKDEWAWLHFDLSVGVQSIFILEQEYLSSKRVRLSRSVDEGRSWGSIPVPDSLELSGTITIAFRDSLQGFLIASNPTSPMEWVLYSTRTAGRTWKKHHDITYSSAIAGNSPFGVPLCWVSDSIAVTTGTTGLFMKTNDGGDTWSKTNSVPTITQSIRMNSTGTGYVVGKSLDVWRTSDTGRTWIKLRDASSENFGSGEMASDSTFVAITALGDRIQTTDAGITWIDNQINEFDFIHRLQMVDDNVGYMTGQVHTSGLIERNFRTNDGGKSWSQFRTPAPENATIIGASSDVVYAIQTFPGSDSLVHVSRDGGMNWTLALTDTINIAFSPLFPMHHRYQRGADTLLIPMKGAILKTTDGGGSWQGYNSLTGNYRQNEYLIALNMRNPMYSWMLTTHRVFRSSNDGRSWDTVFVVPPGGTKFAQLAVSSGSSVVVMTDAYYLTKIDSGKGLLFRTVDGGASWTSSAIYGCSPPREQPTFPLTESGRGAGIDYKFSRIENGKRMELNTTTDFWNTYSNGYVRNVSEKTQSGACFIDDYTGWVVRRNVICQTSTGGVNSAIPAPIPMSSALHPNFPNPITSHTSIPFTISATQEQSVSIDLYDSMGSRVLVIYEGKAAPGDTTVQLDATDLTPGLYFIRLRTSESQAIRKVLVVR